MDNVFIVYIDYETVRSLELSDIEICLSVLVTSNLSQYTGI